MHRKDNSRMTNGKTEPRHIAKILESKMNISKDSSSPMAASLESERLCDHCGQPIPPLLFDKSGQPVAEPALATYSIPRAYCLCPGAQAQRERDESDRAKAEWLTQARQLIAPLDVGKYSDYRFSAWDDSRNPGAAAARRAIQDYTNDVIAGETKRWLYLWGAYGLGKTHLAIAAVRQIAAEKLWEPQVVVWPQHCSAVKESWDMDSGEAGLTEGKLWALMRRANILLIDDIDKTDTTRWAVQKLYEVVDHRVIRRKATIITANHSIDQLRQLWLKGDTKDTGLAILSRFSGELYGSVAFTGKDQRQTREDTSA